jgi:hypothetical protein
MRPHVLPALAALWVAFGWPDDNLPLKANPVHEEYHAAQP